jgi:hypothetical protein
MLVRRERAICVKIVSAIVLIDESKPLLIVTELTAVRKRIPHPFG